MGRRNQTRIGGDFEPMEILLPREDGTGDTKWISRKATKSVKLRVGELADEIAEIIKHARAAAGLPEKASLVLDDKGQPVTDSDGNVLLADPQAESDFELDNQQSDAMLELIAGQITAMTKPAAAESPELGDELLRRYELDDEDHAVIDDDIVGLRNQLRSHLGNRSAS